MINRKYVKRIELGDYVKKDSWVAGRGLGDW